MKKSFAATFLTLATLAASCLAERVGLYIGSTGPGPEGGIYFSQLNEKTGRITPPKQVVQLEASGFQALSPDGKSLLSTSKGPGKPGGTISLFTIGEDHSLTKSGETSIKGNRACHVSFDRTGRMAMFADYGGGSIGSARIEDDGSLAPLSSFIKHEGSGPNPKRQKRPHAHSIYPCPENEYAYAANLGTDRIEIYRMDLEKGSLTSVGHATTPPGAGPRHLKFSKDGSRVYVLNELTTSISVFKRLDKGQLERIQDLSTLPEASDREGMTCSEIRVHPSGRFVFTANRDTMKNGRDSLTVFEVTDDGSLARRSITPAEVSIPRNIQLSPSGSWLITGGQLSNDLVVFSVNAESGALEKTGSKVPCPSPMCYVFLD